MWKEHEMCGREVLQKINVCPYAVSYTHLDVYKRQAYEQRVPVTYVQIYLVVIYCRQ